MLMKHIFVQQLPLGRRNLQSWLFDLFARAPQAEPLLQEPGETWEEPQTAQA